MLGQFPQCSGLIANSLKDIPQDQRIEALKYLIETNECGLIAALNQVDHGCFGEGECNTASKLIDEQLHMHYS